MKDISLEQAYPDMFTESEAMALAALMGPASLHRGRSRVIRANTPLRHSAYLTYGFLGRFACDRFGRRQFTALQIPGDYVDLAAYPLKTLDHDIDALGDATVRLTPHPDLDRVLEDAPLIAWKLWRISLIDAAIHRYWIFRIGRLGGKTRIANFFSEMFLRLFARGLAQPDGFAMPLSQTDLAEICGMTPVHLNRLLAELRLDGVCIFGSGRLEILDLGKLIRVGEHNADYLYLPDSVTQQVRALIA